MKDGTKELFPEEEVSREPVLREISDKMQREIEDAKDGASYLIWTEAERKKQFYAEAYFNQQQPCHRL